MSEKLVVSKDKQLVGPAPADLLAQKVAQLKRARIEEERLAKIEYKAWEYNSALMALSDKWFKIPEEQFNSLPPEQKKVLESWVSKRVSKTLLAWGGINFAWISFVVSLAFFGHSELLVLLMFLLFNIIPVVSTPSEINFYCGKKSLLKKKKSRQKLEAPSFAKDSGGKKDAD